MKITQPKVGAKINLKRLNLAGCAITVHCPTCKEEVQADYSEDGGHSFTYPRLSEPFTVHLFCDGCDTEIPVKVQMDLSIRLVENGC